MAGKSDDLLRRLICAFVLLAAAATAATAEPVRGRSRDLGVTFELTGGEQWCATTVTVQLGADNASVYQPEGIPFLQMIGRIRAIINDQCPTVERIALEGSADGKKVFAAEMTRLTRWRRIIPIDPETQRPKCPPALTDRIECDKRIAAYTTMSFLMRGPAFADAEITSFLEQRTDLHVAWQQNGVYGAVKISHRSDYGNHYTTNDAFADANLQSIEQACTASGGQSQAMPAATGSVALAYRGRLCRHTGQPIRASILLVASQGDWFYVISLWAEEPHIEAASTQAKSLAEAIAAQR
jgi:hypothetical protein